MQKKNTSFIMQLMKSMQHEKWINFRFIGLLFIAFMLQHLSFATLQNSFGLKKLKSGITQDIYFEKSTTNHNASELDLFIEDSSEDEDEIHNEHVVYSEIFYCKLSINILHYTASINTLYLRLASSNLNKVDIPFFVRYHSWKSHLA